MSLFAGAQVYQPLAARMRPRTIEDVVGQEHLLGQGKALRKAIESSGLHSMILWGPPGVGKTTIASVIAEVCQVHYLAISAVLAGVKDIRAAIDIAEQQRQLSGKQTLLFVDEAHRFNKSQQDAFLPFVEDGRLIFVGATTENPSFEVNNALLSRSRVYKLKAIGVEDVTLLLRRALADCQHGLGANKLQVATDILAKLALAADGDARRALNFLEVASDLAQDHVIDDAILQAILGSDVRRFDKGGGIFYAQISALHKAVRGSSPDAALYWFARMLDGGCDPLYIARRVTRMASEDIGNADPRALQIALNAWEAQDKLGSPEGELAIAQAIVYLAVAAKSNAVYIALAKASADVATKPSFEVPMHIRNAPTQMMKDQGYGADYRYAHDAASGFVPGENYFPEPLKDSNYYEPVARGMEIRIAEKLKSLRELNQQSDFQRYGE